MAGKRAVANALSARDIADITVSVNYRLDTGFQQDESRPESMGKVMPVSVKMLDARSRKLSMLENGFELIDQPTGMSREDFFNDQLVKQKYYPLCQEAIKQVTGAPIVMCFHHLVRGHATGEPFAGIAHADYSTKTAHKVLQDMPPPGIKEFKGRLCVLNLWRNINPDSPLQNHFLAMCDGASVLAPDDFISVSMAKPGKEETHMYHMSANNHRLHKWYYYPVMTANESLMFMQYDSDPHMKCRYTFHSSVSVNDGTLEYKRESIEVRCVAYFPDAENTMPDWTLPADMRIDAAVDACKQHTRGFVTHHTVRSHKMGAASYIMAENHKGWILEFLEHNRKVAHHAAYKDLTDDQQDEVAEMVLKDTSWKRFMDEWAPSMYDGKDALGVAVEFVEQHLLSFPSWDAVNRDRTKAAIQAGHMKEMVIGTCAHFKGQDRYPFTALKASDWPTVWKRLQATELQEKLRDLAQEVLASNSG
ncbi:unnamed protein product [Effrenium voratum]|nr:unnamed protein product [Effrenium voratum]